MFVAKVHIPVICTYIVKWKKHSLKNTVQFIIQNKARKAPIRKLLDKQSVYHLQIPSFPYNTLLTHLQVAFMSPVKCSYKEYTPLKIFKKRYNKTHSHKIWDSGNHNNHATF